MVKSRVAAGKSLALSFRRIPAKRLTIMIFFQSLTQSDLAELLLPLSKRPEKAAAQARYRAKQIFHWVYQRHVLEWDEMSDLSKDLRVWLKENIQIYRLTERMNRQALDGTHKFLWD